jgi:hypothetical protein
MLVNQVGDFGLAFGTMGCLANVYFHTFIYWVQDKE